ncbi:hypothetical protein [Nocardioides sp. Leaf285]|uniref:hypothetical protein n=1 Tax=Nocardioides sp. Leaf285 TaxID=1736322 RepID=UPI0012E9BCB3|nr:hypothetical protein [Nocardioides sp. Leaf285]
MVAALRSAVAQRCTTCGRPRANDEQWETTSGGERTDLCWEITSESCPWVGMVDLDEVRAAAVLGALRLEEEQGGAGQEERPGEVRDRAEVAWSTYRDQRAAEIPGRDQRRLGRQMRKRDFVAGYLAAARGGAVR